MKIEELFKHKLKEIPLSEYVNEVKFFEEYKELKPIPDRYLFINMFIEKEFKGEKVDNISQQILEEKEREFYKAIGSKTLSDKFKSPDLSQSETAKNLIKLEEVYSLFLKDISSNKTPVSRSLNIIDAVGKFSKENQLSLIDHLCNDESLSKKFATGEIVLNDKRSVPELDGSFVFEDPKIDREIIKQRLQDFTTKLLIYKNSISENIPEKATKPSIKKEVKFETYLNSKITINNEIREIKKGDEWIYLSDLRKICKKNDPKELAESVYKLEEEKVFKPFGIKNNKKALVRLLFNESFTISFYNSFLDYYNDLKPKNQ